MEYCIPCSRYFVDIHALEQHKNSSPSHRSKGRTRNGSYYCPQCGKNFNTDNGLINHSDSVHYFCISHRQYFNSDVGLRSHYIQKSDHFYCKICDELFDDDEDLMAHGDDEHWVCEPCALIFESSDELEEHDEDEHYYCRKCARYFERQSNLDTHLNHSAYHLPRTIVCPGKGCSARFLEISGLTLHAESGACRGGITRKAVNQFVARMDRKNVITNPNRLLTGPDGISQPPEEVEYWATDLSFNGKAFECFLCHGKFQTLQALNAHLKSPRHLDRIYRCPMKGCNTEYPVLSALCQHVERGGCGIRENRSVQDKLESLTRGMRGIKL